jgi:hypothetical protein
MENLWYRWTTWWNPYGDIVRWVERAQNGDILECKGLARREDGLLFEGTRCYTCTPEEADKHYRNGTKLAHRRGHYLRGQTTDAWCRYGNAGRELEPIALRPRKKQ